MITKPKEKSLAVLISELDSVFSEFIRVRDAKPFSGLVHCFICGVAIPWRASQAMHFIDRDQMPTRFDEINVNGGCESCNMTDDLHLIKYENTMLLRYGSSVVNSMILKSRNLQKYVRPELIEMIGYYKGKVQELRKQKHI